MSASSSTMSFRRVGRDGASATLERPLVREEPLSIEFDGIGYAVTMASPCDLVDLAFGYALAERIVTDAAEILDVSVEPVPLGTAIRIHLAEDRRMAVAERVRHRMAGSSCGLCGIENLEQALRPLPHVARQPRAGEAAIFRALEAMRAHQPLNRTTGAAHAALLCAADGTIRLAREDVGRHNAFDKLIGATMREGLGWDGGFALLSSRCSYELVEKAALAGCPMLVTVSAATDLAVRRASEAGIALVSLARDDAVLVSE